MKKINALLFALSLLSCAVGFASPNFTESRITIVKNGDLFKIIYHGPMESTVKVTILDADENRIFTEKIISHGKFIRPYNLSQLPKGDYMIWVDDSNGQYMERLCTSETKKIDELTAHVAKLKGTENKYIVSIPRQAQDDEFALHIYDQDQQLIFSEKQNPENDFAKVYVLKNLDRAMIKIVNQTSGQEKLFQVE